MAYPNGEKYEGEFVNGRYHGRGTFSFAQDRVPMEGLWEDGRFVQYERADWR